MEDDFQIEMDVYKATNNKNTTLCQYLRFFGRSGAHVDFGELNMFHGLWKNLRKKHWQVGLYHHPIGNIYLAGLHYPDHLSPDPE